MAVAVTGPFHVVRPAGGALDECRRRVQLAIRGHRGHDDPTYAASRTLRTAADLLTDKQKDRLRDLFAGYAHVEVEATGGSTSGWAPPTVTRIQRTGARRCRT